MARTARQPKDNYGEIKVKDPALVKRLYFSDIKPNRAKIGELSKENSDAFKSIQKDANVQRGSADFVFKVLNMEEAKRDDFLRGVHVLFGEFNIDFPPRDMVDMMGGDDGYARPKIALVTVPSGPEGDGDLLGDE